MITKVPLPDVGSSIDFVDGARRGRFFLALGSSVALEIERRASKSCDCASFLRGNQIVWCFGEVERGARPV